MEEDGASRRRGSELAGTTRLRAALVGVVVGASMAARSAAAAAAGAAAGPALAGDRAGRAVEPPLEEDTVAVAPPADHHVHVWSEDARDVLVRIISRTRGAEAPPIPVIGVDGLLARMDSAGIRHAVLLSTAYLYGSPDVDVADERARVRAENDWVTRQAAAHPGRFVAFFGVDPLASYAPEEAERCARVEACRGMKLQLAAADFDFRDPAHVARLRAIFARANELGLPVVIHLQTRRPDFGAREVETFVDRVLPVAREIPVQIAHMGGNSRFDSATVRAFGALARAYRDHPERMEKVLLDMALVPFPPQRAAGDSARQDLYRRWNRHFAEAVRRVGADRVLFGTDYPEARPDVYARQLWESLPLTREELRALFDHRAPYLNRAEGR